MGGGGGAVPPSLYPALKWKGDALPWGECRRQGCIGREGTSEAAPEVVRQAVGGGCQSGWGAVTVGYKCCRGRQLASGGQWLGMGWAPWKGRGGGGGCFEMQLRSCRDARLPCNPMPHRSAIRCTWGDLWQSAAATTGLKSHDLQAWLPFEFGPDGLPLPLQNVDRWTLDVPAAGGAEEFEECPAPGPKATGLDLPPRVANRNVATTATGLFPQTQTPLQPVPCAGRALPATRQMRERLAEVHLCRALHCDVRPPPRARECICGGHSLSHPPRASGGGAGATATFGGRLATKPSWGQGQRQRDDPQALAQPAFGGPPAAVMDRLSMGQVLCIREKSFLAPVAGAADGASAPLDSGPNWGPGGPTGVGGLIRGQKPDSLVKEEHPKGGLVWPTAAANASPPPSHGRPL